MIDILLLLQAAAPPQQLSATAKKFTLMGVELRLLDECSTATSTDTNTATSTAKDNSDDDDELFQGNRIINVGILSDLFSMMACPNCFETGPILSESKKMGLSFTLSVSCQKCGHTISNKASPSVGEGKHTTAESNLLFAAGTKNIGIGYHKGAKLFGHMNLPVPMCVKTYQSLSAKVHDAAIEAAKESMVKAREIARGAAVPGTVVSRVVSYDGTWHKRGHSSHYGVGVICDLDTGLVLDYHTMSNFCKACEDGPTPDQPEYADWAKKHKPKCQLNYQGSANSMEVAAAKELFPRSLNDDLKYTTILCDGDSKTVSSLNDLNPYGEEIIKEDCVNHVAKRMWHAIDKIRSEKRLTGKKGITLDQRDLLAKYYAKALKNNAPEIKDMKRAVYASVFHMVSTDVDPHHSHCPDGDKSWCFFKRAAALNETPREHTPTLTKEVAEHLLPAYERLTKEDLLKRCSRMKTQNSNECFNAQIWRRCSKTEATSLHSVETAAALAVVEFNGGPQGFYRVLQHLGISPGMYQKDQATRDTIHRLKRSAAAAKDSNKRRRKKMKVVKAHKHNERLAAEGTTYSAGAFNS
jgi:hypothetical protein